MFGIGDIDRDGREQLDEVIAQRARVWDRHRLGRPLLHGLDQQRVHVHETELRQALARRGVKARGRYRPAMWAHQPNWQTYGERGEPWHGFAAVRSLVGVPEELLLVPLSGHTLGHCGVAVDTESGWLLDAGDAFFDPRQLAQTPEIDWHVGLFERVVTTDKRQRLDNQARLRELTATHPEISVFCSHDPSFTLVDQAGHCRVQRGRVGGCRRRAFYRP